MKTKIMPALLKMSALVVLLSTLNSQLSTFAQGTAFTYQGRLNDGANPANGSYDLTFALFSVNSGAGQVGNTLTNLATVVSNGVFTVTLDFGTGIFTGPDRWLEIGARTNGGAFITLSPRQQLRSTPYAVTAGGVVSGGITSDMLAGGAVTGDKIAAGAVQGFQIDDGGGAVYQGFQQAAQSIGGDTSISFAELSPVKPTNGTPPSFVFTLNGSTFGTVVGFSGNEGISQPYAYAVEVVYPGAVVNPDAELGLNGRLTYTRNGRSTSFGGLVTGCSLSASNGSSLLLSFRLESPLALMALRTDYKIFQTKTAPTVAAMVYTNDTGNTAAQSLATGYTLHESLVQFGETDLNFFSRILEYEGISYFFNHGANPPGLILGDNAAAYLASPNSPFSFYGNMNTNVPSGTEYIQTFQKAFHQSTLTSVVSAYDFKNPSALQSGTSSGTEGTGSLFEFDSSGIETAAYNQLISQVRQDHQTAARATMAGSGTAPDLRAGYTFALNDQSSAGLGGTYLVTSIHHAGFVRVTNGVSTLFYGNQFQVIPASLIFRPPLATPKPQAQPCVAAVTGPGGEEIYTDQYGRVKVQFKWDRQGQSNENSSAWIRVTSPMAGGSGRGMMFLPRIGDEVLVSFVQGDPDQPVITGSLYNSNNMPPYTLPGSKTVSTIRSTGSIGQPTQINEIRFEDKVGSQEVFIQSAKDLYLQSANDTTLSIGNNLTLSTTGNATLAAGGSLNIQSGSQTTFTGPVSVGSLTASSVSTSTESVVGGMNIDQANLNNGGVSANALTFGNGSGEGIGSKRTTGTGQFSLALYTDFLPRMTLANNGNVGIGETNPSAPLHILGPVAAPPGALNAADNGLLLGSQSTTGYKWIQSYGGPLVLNPVGNNVGVSTTNPTHAFQVGNAFCDGNTWSPASDRNLKAGIQPVDVNVILSKVAALPIASWHYTNDVATPHLGPMAQDFYAAFGVGADDRHISDVDEGGVALAAIQGLNQKLEEQRAENADLKQRLEKLERLMTERSGDSK